MLHLAAQRGNIAVLEYILTHLDLNINIKDKIGRTPLHHAIESSRGLKTIVLLISHDADFSAKDDSRQTPNQVAEKNEAQIVESGLTHQHQIRQL